jgi:hypothetical protein
MNKPPDAKIIAMINDLSVEALASLLCFHERIVTKFRQTLSDEYRDGNLPAETIIEAWENDE